MLTKAAKENIVVGLTNMHDQLFVSTETRYSKVTTARLPYFDGDCWSAAAMDQAEIIEKERGSDYGNALKKVLKSRSLKSMGYFNIPKAKAKDILVMEKVCRPSLITSSNCNESLNWFLKNWIPLTHSGHY